MARSAARLTVALALALLGGCAGTVTVRGTVVRPATIPVRAFPRILVVSGETPEADRLADAIAARLAGSSAQVRRLDEAELDALEARGGIGPATAILRLELRLDQTEEPRWNRQSTLMCGPLGCAQSQRPYLQDVPVVVGRLVIAVVDATSGRQLQRETVRAEEAGLDDLGARLRVVERLEASAHRLLLEQHEQVPVELVAVDDPSVQVSLRLLQDGEWTRAREGLERLVEIPRFRRFGPEAQAAVLYDLGQIRRFDPSLPEDTRFDLADEMLRRAVRLHPSPRYASAISDLAEDRERRAVVLRQREAMAHNYALIANDGGGPIPDPPASYRR
ncbi:MAG: hypothetical protein AB7S26_32995 [Sandaracinaceae bacterium]